MTEKTMSEIEALFKNHKDTGHKLIIASNKLSTYYNWFSTNKGKLANNSAELPNHEETCGLILEQYLSFVDKENIARIAYAIEGCEISISKLDMESFFLAADYATNKIEDLVKYGVWLKYNHETDTRLHPQELNSIVNHLDALDKICKVLKPIAYSLTANTRKAEMCSINKYSSEVRELGKYINSLDKDSILLDRFSKLLCDILAESSDSVSKISNASEKLDAINKNSENIFYSLIFWRKLKNILDLDSENRKDV